MEPVRRACHPSQTVDHPVIAPHMLEFVDQCPLQVFFVPALRIFRKHDNRAQDTARHRSRQRFVYEDFNPAPCAWSQPFGYRLPVPPRQAKSAQEPELPQPPDDRNGKERNANEPSVEQHCRERYCGERPQWQSALCVSSAETRRRVLAEWWQ